MSGYPNFFPWATVSIRLARRAGIQRIDAAHGLSICGPGDPKHPDAANIARLFPPNRFGGLVSFELKGANRAEIFRFMEKLQMVVRATSLGDVHSMILNPAMASHRDLSPKHRERLGIRNNLVRLSIGIEAHEDIVADLEQALSA